MLLDYFDNEQLENINYEKILFEAIENDMIEIFDIIVSLGPDIDCCKSDYGTTPLMNAAGNAKFNIVKKLVKLGADVNKVDYDGDTALYYAAAYEKDYWIAFADSEDNGKRIKIAKFLIDNGCNIKNTNNMGRTALFGAVEWERCELIKFFIENGLDINQQDILGVTPLMHAVKCQKVNSVAFLLKCGADKKIKDMAGKTVIDYVNEMEESDEVKKIRELLK